MATLEDKDSVSLWRKGQICLLSSMIKMMPPFRAFKSGFLPIIKNLRFRSMVEIPLTVCVVTIQPSSHYLMGPEAQGASGPETTEAAR